MNLRNVMILAGAMMAVSANAQFGVATKNDFSFDNGKQGLYGVYSPFARISSGGASANGYFLALDKLIDAKAADAAIFGGAYSRLDGTSSWQFHYRRYIQEDASLQLAIYGGDGFNNKTDFSVLYFKDLPKQGENPLSVALTGGLYRDSTDNKFDLAFGVKLAYPLQNGFSVDASFLQTRRAGESANLITIGVGYRF